MSLLALKVLVIFLVVPVFPCAWAVPVDLKAKALAHYITGVVHDLNCDSQKAVIEYQDSYQLNQQEIAPRLKLGVFYLRAGKVKEAKGQILPVIRTNPDSWQAHYLLGLVYSSEHATILSARQFEQVLLLKADDPAVTSEINLELGQSYYVQGQYAKAIRKINGVLEDDPQDVAALFLLGSLYTDMHNHPKAMLLFRQVVQLEPDNSEALNALGYVYAEDDIHLDEAVGMIKRAIVIDPSNGAYYDTLGWAYFKKGMLEASLANLLKAVTLTKNDILFDHIAQVYETLKQYPLALKFWRQSLVMDPQQFQVKQKIENMEKWIASQSPHQLN